MAADKEWDVVFHPEFVDEFRGLDREIKVGLGAVFDLLREDGPHLGRPHVDTLNGSRHANMKEIRVDVASDWYRCAFAFDPVQRAVVLCGGGKGGGSQKKFYAGLVRVADSRFDEWLTGDE